MARKMKDSGIEWIGLIPEDWNIIKNKYNFELNKEIVGDEWENTQLLSLTKSGIKRINDGEQSGKVPMSYSTYQKVKRNEIVMCLFDLDVSAVFSGLSPFDGMISPAYKCFKCGTHIIPKYIDYYFKTVFVDRKYKRYSKNVRFSLGTEEFMNLSIIVPSLEEQKKIADFLDEKVGEIDNVIETTKATIEDYKKYKQSVITEAVTKGLNPDFEMKDSGIEWIEQIPSDWNVDKLKNLFDFGKGLPITKADLTEDGISVISYGQIHSKTNTGTGIKDDLIRFVPESYLECNSNSLVHKNDFILADTSEDREGCGNCVYIDSEQQIFAGYHTIILQNKDRDDTKYLAYLFLTDAWRSQIRSRVTGVKLFSITQKIIKETTLILPPEEEQKKIVDFLDEKISEIDNIISIKEQLIEDMENYKKSLIYEYVTGKKEVSDNE